MRRMSKKNLGLLKSPLAKKCPFPLDLEPASIKRCLLGFLSIPSFLTKYHFRPMDLFCEGFGLAFLKFPEVDQFPLNTW